MSLFNLCVNKVSIPPSWNELQGYMLLNTGKTLAPNVTATQKKNPLQYHYTTTVFHKIMF